jgi:TolB-like protein
MLLAAPTLLLAPRPSAADGSTLWVLSVGVSRYADSRLDLTFADRDARSVAAALADQQGRRVYSRVESRVLVDADVRRESILTGIRDFIEKAEADDVATIFMAGHGVRDLLTGTYYFLPHDATPDDFFTRGLRVEELTDMVRILQRHVRHVVVILDTCHAGAVDPGAPQMESADDFATRIRAEGVFLLAATQPGEKSRELRRLGHGVFTWALLGALGGGANAGDDGLLSLAELVIHLGSEVTRLTDGAQRPYYLIAGSDLVFADVRAPNSVVVFPFRNQDASAPDNDWMATDLQESLHLELARVPALSVCPLPEDDDASGPLRQRARRLGCGRFVTGSFVVDGDEIELRARVVDTAGDGDEASASVRGRRDEFAALKARLVADLLAAMPTVRTYRMMLEAQGIDGGESAPGRDDDTGDADEENDEDDRGAFWSPWLPSLSLAARADAQETAMARTPPSAEAQIRDLLDAYEAAHEAKEIARLESLWVRFTGRQQEALRRYFDAAGDLSLELADVRIEPHGDDATVALTHIARFVDRESGKPVRLEVRQRMILVRRDGDWKIERIESRREP